LPEIKDHLGPGGAGGGKESPSLESRKALVDP
jgi:hypothetical protein